MVVVLEVDIGVQSHGERACIKSEDGIGRSGLAHLRGGKGGWFGLARIQRRRLDNIESFCFPFSNTLYFRLVGYSHASEFGGEDS